MAEEWLQGMKMDREVLVRTDTPRNPGHHRLLMAMLKIVLDNTDGRWSGMDDLLTDLKIATGLVERRINQITQQEYVVAKSIAFASMNQEEFDQWFKICVGIIAINVLDVKQKEIIDRIMEMAGERRSAA